MKNKREDLANYAHEAWAGWMKYMMSKCVALVPDDKSEPVKVAVPRALYDRWKFQVETNYADLPEEMKPSDRNEADKILAIVGDLEQENVAIPTRKNNE